ncbi:DMT family transporter [Oceanisphaera psychrotolerans]|uniref:Multidrug DMT transporter permease n=1 Tax=Oceanisphaera psychrotolerans TaxID=1414654 RepID=A0A1J4QGF2_9GAMM|nr:DMT family transporter [Oceanisphaera psychrotolerans]OIN12756.1 multidrug DMT transporter permease [Oceanisphaera psychrotolerans]
MATLQGIMAISLWSLLALLGALTTTIPAFQLLFICFSVSALLMFAGRLVHRRPLLSPPALSPGQWLVGIVGLFGFHWCYFTALQWAPALEVSLIVYLWPLLLSLLVAGRGRRHLAALGGLLGFGGVAVLMAPSGDAGLAGDVLVGYGLSLCCALIWAGYSWYLSRSQGQAEDIGWVSLVVALLSLLVHLTTEQGHWSFSIPEGLGALLLGLGPVGGAFYLWDRGLKQGNRALLASLSFATPLLSSVVLVLAGINEWRLATVVALVLIMLGAGVANLKPRLPAALKEGSVSG